VNHNW